MYKLGLLTVLDEEGGDGNNVHPVLSSVLMDAAMGAIDKLSDVSF